MDNFVCVPLHSWVGASRALAGGRVRGGEKMLISPVCVFCCSPEDRSSLRPELGAEVTLEALDVDTLFPTPERS